MGCHALLLLFNTGTPVVRTPGRSVYGHVISEFSWMDSLPHFFTMVLCFVRERFPRRCVYLQILLDVCALYTNLVRRITKFELMLIIEHILRKQQISNMASKNMEGFANGVKIVSLTTYADLLPNLGTNLFLHNMGRH